MEVLNDAGGPRSMLRFLEVLCLTTSPKNIKSRATIAMNEVYSLFTFLLNCIVFILTII